MAKTTIYVPDELKVEMDKIKGSNWSKLAQRAFEIEVQSNQTGDKDMIEAARERLMASKQAAIIEETPMWIQDGQEWALGTAEYRELRNIQKIDTDDYLNDADALLKAMADSIYQRDADRYDIAELVEQISGEEHFEFEFNQLAAWHRGTKQAWEELNIK